MPTFKMQLPDTSKLSLEKKVEALENSLTELINRLMWQQGKLDSQNVKRVDTNETVVKSRNGETYINGPLIQQWDAQSPRVKRLEMGYDESSDQFTLQMWNKLGLRSLYLDDNGDGTLRGIFRTAEPDNDRLEFSGGVFSGYTSLNQKTGMYFNIGSIPGTGIADIIFYHNNTPLLQLYDNTDSYTIKGYTGATKMGLGSTSVPTKAYGAWTFDGTVDFTDAGVVGLSSEEIEGFATVATSGDYNDLINTPAIPDQLSDLADDSTHRTVTDTEKSTWNGHLTDTSAHSTLFAAKPALPTGSAGVGQIVAVQPADNTAYTLPSGGTWFYHFYICSSSTGATAGTVYVGVASGGATVANATPGYYYRGMAWRIS